MQTSLLAMTKSSDFTIEHIDSEMKDKILTMIIEERKARDMDIF